MHDLPKVHGVPMCHRGSHLPVQGSTCQAHMHCVHWYGHEHTWVCECWATSSWHGRCNYWATIVGNVNDKDLDGLHTCTHTDQSPMNVRDTGMVGAYMPTCQHAYMPTCLHVNILTCTHAYMPTCLYAYMLEAGPCHGAMLCWQL